MKQIISLAIYWIIILFGLSLPMFERKIRNKKRFLYLLSLVISVVLSFRGIGFDLKTYQGIYEYGVASLSSVFSLSSLEPFFSLEIFIMRLLGLKFSVFLFINLLLPLLIVAYVTGKFEKYPVSCYGMFLAWQIFNFDVIRSFLAWAIYLYVLYHYDYLRSKVIAVLNVFVHYSQIIACLFWPALDMRIRRNSYVRAVILTLFISVCIGRPAINLLLHTSFLQDFIIMEKFRTYLSSYELEVNVYLNWLHELLAKATFFMNFLFAAGAILLTLSKGELKKLERRLVNSQIAGSILMVFFCGIGAITLGNRLNKSLGIGMFILYNHYFFHSGSSKTLKHYYIFGGLLLLYNLIITFSYAGIYNPESMIYKIFSR